MLDALHKSATEGRLSILVGAGASIESPSSACGWYDFRDEILDALLGIILTPSSDDDSWRRNVEQLKNNNLSPEVLLDAIDRFSGFSAMTKQRNLCSALDLGNPNRTHMSIAALVKTGFVANVFTTNWDSFLERTLEPQVPLLVVRGYEDVQSISNKDQEVKRLLYLHGSVRANYVQGGLWRLGFALNSNIYLEFIRCAAGQDILVLGYSGADWDILKILAIAIEKHDTR